ncbi:alpha,alpha-trehalose-phosphate synthase (UDP-forming) [Zhihengliuella halotolerans]|uniref:alpha,alpha-trehalose-phosphate synthase (UDP-forming) n=1 Tax=Zhihengliuella halotolerans TaxID=370736 RepID=UPI000C7FE443|nr:trehalose-6-phosphate synthase [Zhihengliuella halotolerans]
MSHSVDGTTRNETYDFVVVANRLPVDRVVNDAGESSWKRAPGGLVTALAPVMEAADGAWVGWHGAPDEEVEPFENNGISIVPVPLSESDVNLYYEGFSNSTLWPLYHDVIVAPRFHRAWWDRYKKINQRFADATAAVAAEGATVWVQDYQLQLVPKLLKDVRPDLKIGFFNHIPFPSVDLFAQLPWRKRVLEGLLGADLIGFQRPSDASNFLRAVRRILGFTVRGQQIHVQDAQGNPLRIARAEAHPISIDSASISRMAKDPKVQARAKEIRRGLGNPDVVVLGVDRLDYTKGIRHRLKAFGELIDDGRLEVGGAALVQVASPSRERVGEYMKLRDEIELTVGRINGEHDTVSHTAIRYLHHSYPFEEMVALYLAADVMLVTALRDGMNLVAKEYVAAHVDNKGALVLSEFAGAADQLKHAFLVNPHDIDDLKDTIVAAIALPEAEASRRMRIMRRQIATNDVARWSRKFLESLAKTDDELSLDARNRADEERAGHAAADLIRPRKPDDADNE